MWAECLDCNVEAEKLGHRENFPATKEGWAALQQYLRKHEKHDIDVWTADYKDDDRCPFPDCVREV